MTFSDNSGLAG